MAGTDDVLEIAKANFESVHANLDQDLADATTAAATRAVMDNHDAALAAYMRAIRASLDCSGDGWQKALADARQAQADVEKARADAVSFDKRLAKMATLTGKVGDLLDAVKG